MATGPPTGCQLDESLREESQDLNSQKYNEGGGYGCEFVKHPPEELQAECAICLQILREPHLISCCGNNYCRLCIHPVQQKNGACPLCNEESFTILHNKGLQRTLNSFTVRCVHSQSGCEWVGELGKLEEHLNENPDEQLNGCEFVEIKCMYCTEYFQRRNIGAHQIATCPNRPFSCDYCGVYQSTHEDVVHNHWTVCECRPASCPNDCGVYPKRKDLECHVKKDCLLQVVDCDFHYAGCEVKLPRREMAAHLLQASLAHTSFLAAANHKLAEKLVAKDIQNDQFREEMQEFKGKILQLEKEGEKLRDQVHRETHALKQEFAEVKQSFEKAMHEQKTENLALKEKLLKVGELERESLVVKENFVRLQDQQEEASEAFTHALKQISDIQTQREVELQTQVDAVKQAISDEREVREYQLGQEQAVVREELGQLKQKQVEFLQLQSQQEGMSSRESEMLHQEIASLSKQREDDAESLQRLESYAGILPVEFSMTNFGQHLRDRDEWCSPPFFSHPHGYKMCLRVYASGKGNASGSHVSVNICLLRGEFDQHLQWPFSGDVTIQLLNQLADKDHCTHYIYYDWAESEDMRRVGKQGTSQEYGQNRFLALNELEDSGRSTTCQYLKDDCIRVRVTRITKVDPIPQLIKQCHAIEPWVSIAPVEITMTNFAELKRNNDRWFSAPFYTHERGYRMCIGVFPNGYMYSNAHRYHVSVFVYLMSGSFDSTLKWPFGGIVTIKLLNHSHKVCISESIDFKDSTLVGIRERLMVGERARGWGIPAFLPHWKLDFTPVTQNQFLMNDCLRFQVTVKVPKW